MPSPRHRDPDPAITQAAAELASGPVAASITKAAELLHARRAIEHEPPVPVIAAAIADCLGAALAEPQRAWIAEAAGEGRGRRIAAREEVSLLLGLTRQSLEKRLGLVQRRS